MIRKNIPNFITCLNLIAGSMAIVFAMSGELSYAFYLIILAAILDFFDGFAARLLKTHSPIGKDLDSMADMVSFGVAPGIIMFVLLKYSFMGNSTFTGFNNYSHLQKLILSLSLLIPVFSSLRLAIFNNDTRQTSSFIGLPTPANAMFICSLGMIRIHGMHPKFDSFLLSTPSLVVITLFFSYLLVSKISMFSLKFKNITWKDNSTRISFLLLSILLIAAFLNYGLAATIIIYIIISILQNKALGSRSEQ